MAQMALSHEQKHAFFRDGYVVVPGIIAKERVHGALRAINADLGAGIDVAQLARFQASSFCPSLEHSEVLVSLFNDTQLKYLAESLVGNGMLKPAARAQIALRFPELGEARVLRPHLDGTHSQLNGVPAGEVHHFTMLAMVALSDVAEDHAGNFTVWPGTHLRYQEHFRIHGVEAMLHGTPKLEELCEPVQIRLRAGDILLAHYELGHAAAANLSPHVRYAVFVRWRHRDHHEQGLDILGDIWREYAGLESLRPPSITRAPENR